MAPETPIIRSRAISPAWPNSADRHLGEWFSVLARLNIEHLASRAVDHLPITQGIVNGDSDEVGAGIRSVVLSSDRHLNRCFGLDDLCRQVRVARADTEFDRDTIRAEKHLINLGIRRARCEQQQRPNDQDDAQSVSTTPNGTSTSGLGAQLDEAGRCEVLIERKRFAKAAVAHHLEAGRIDERVGPFIVLPQPDPRLVLLVEGDPVEGEFGLLLKCVDTVEESDRSPVTILAPEKRPGLSDHKIGGEHLFGRSEMGEHRQRIGMSSVAGERPCHPPTGVGELHES